MARRLAAIEALREPRYRMLWLAGLCVNTCRWMSFLVLGWLVLQMTDSAEMVAVAAFCRNAPMMALGPFAGIVADRLNRGRVMIGVQLLNLAAASTIAILLGLGRAELWQIVGSELLLGIAWAIDFTPRRTVLYTLVGRERLTSAFSLESISMQSTKMIGPVVGGLLIGRVGPSWCYVLMAALYLTALLLILSLNRRVSLPPLGSTESVLGSLIAGLREVRGQPTILGVLAITVLANALVFPYQQLMPVFARDILHVGPELLGLLVAANGLGALALALFVASRRSLTEHRRLFAGGALGAAVLVVALAVSPWYALSVTIQFLIGMGECAFGTMQSTLVLLNAPDRSCGRIMGILSFCIGTQPLGTLWSGFLAGESGASAATASSSSLAVLLMAPLVVRMFSREAPRPVWVTP